LHQCRTQGLPGIPAAELLNYLRHAAEGLDYLNDKHVQHRDIKPANLLLVGGGVKVGDFGLAKLLEHTAATNTRNALTVAYAAPEAIQKRLHRHSDQYALAVTYCQLRGGRLPCEGDAVQMMYGHLNQRRDRTRLPEVERPVVARALAKKPEERWQGCGAFVEALATAGQEREAARPGKFVKPPRVQVTAPAWKPPLAQTILEPIPPR